MPQSPPKARGFGQPSTVKTRARQFRRRKGSASQRGYDADWRKLRNAYAAAHPLCEPCERAGRVVPMQVVDHRVPIERAPERRLDWSNLESMCRPCHSRKTIAEDGGFGRTPGGGSNPDGSRR
jgi:5-methylcytosine-specific restriction protein A